MSEAELLKFPTDYPIKVVGKPSDDFRARIHAVFLKHVPEVDPWGNDYVYRTEDAGRSFELYSSGPGGETGSDSRFRVTSIRETLSDR